MFGVMGLVFLAGCGTESIRLNMEPAAGSEFVAKQMVDVYLRPAKEEAFGRIGGSKVFVSGFTDCVVSGLRGLGTGDVGFRVVPENDAGVENTGNAGAIRVSVAKAYIHNLAVTKSAIVVLKLEHGGRVSYFRGQKMGVIWFGADAEFRSAIEGALGEALAKIRPALLAAANGKAR